MDGEDRGKMLPGGDGATRETDRQKDRHVGHGSALGLVEGFLVRTRPTLPETLIDAAIVRAFNGVSLT